MVTSALRRRYQIFPDYPPIIRRGLSLQVGWRRISYNRDL